MLAVRKGTVAAPLEPSNEFLQLAQVFLGGAVYIFGSVYLPTKVGKLRKEASTAVKLAIVSLQKKFPSTPISIGGDWNCKLDDLTKLLGTWNIGLRVVKCEGESMTYHKLSGKMLKGSDLDHFVVNEAAFVVATSASVDRGCSASDHWPISFRFRVKTVPHALDAVSDVQIGKVDPYKVRECGSTIAVQGCFVELAKKLSECEAAVETADLDDEGRQKAMESLINASTADLQSAFSDVVESLDLRVDSRKPSMGKHQVSRRFSGIDFAKKGGRGQGGEKVSISPNCCKNGLRKGV